MDLSPFARLPAEIRTIIWQWTFTTHFAVKLQSGGIQHALTKTCRQIRGETLCMYYSMTRLNAHLEDGPATPLAKWFETIGRGNVLLLHDIRIWDMHMLNATLHGDLATGGLLRREDVGFSTVQEKTRVLLPIGSWLLERAFYLTVVVVTLYRMGLELLRVNYVIGRGTPYETSEFAILPIRDVCRDEYSKIDGLVMRLGFEQKMRKEIFRQLMRGQEEICLCGSKWNVILKFKGLEFVSIRQEYVDVMKIGQ